MDFTTEFYHTATVAWACGIISVLCAVEAYRQRAFRWQLAGGVLAGLTGVLCPATLTRGYYEMVVVNQELAAVVAAKRAEGVDNERFAVSKQKPLFDPLFSSLRILSFGKPFWQAILAGRVNTHCLPLFPMRLLIVATPANALKV